MTGRLLVPRAAKPAPWSAVTLADSWAEALTTTAPTAEGAALAQYQADPLGFLVDVLGIAPETLRWSLGPEYGDHQWDGSRDPLLAAMEAVARGQWVAVSSGTGTGKTFLMAAMLLWHTASFEDSIAVTVATKEDQMAKGVWREVGRLFPRFATRFPKAELTTLRLRMDPTRGDAWAAWGITAKVVAGETSNTSVQGLHAPRLLILCDEMPGIPQPIITALENTATDPGNIIAGFGNPDNDTDPLAKFSRKAGVQAIRISALDHPNVVTGRTLVPGAVSRASIVKRAEDYGVESPLYGSRVQGIAPAQATDALIHRAWCDAAVARGRAWSEPDARGKTAMAGLPVAYGVDPSNSDGGDDAAVARFQGPLCTEVRASPCPDANVLGMTVWLRAQSDYVDPAHIGVDSIGVGAGTVNEMRRVIGTASPMALNGGATPQHRATQGADGEGWSADANQFLNLRAQMHWQLREDLRRGLVGLPDDPALIEELVMATYQVRSGKVVLESKDDIKKRLGRSPNRSDAVVYANWVRPRTRPAPVVMLPRDKDLGLTKVNGKLRPRSPDDLFRAELRKVQPQSDKWWKGW